MAKSDKNHAAERLKERRESILQVNPDPPRSEIVDMMLAEALQREQQLSELKAEKGGSRGLQAAQRKPVTRKVEPVPAADNEAIKFFEDLLTPMNDGETKEENNE